MLLPENGGICGIYRDLYSPELELSGRQWPSLGIPQ